MPNVNLTNHMNSVVDLCVVTLRAGRVLADSCKRNGTELPWSGNRER